MKTWTGELKLTQQAKRFGGDKYEFGQKGTIDHVVFYFPQFISRNEGTPPMKVKVTIEEVK